MASRFLGFLAFLPLGRVVAEVLGSAKTESESPCGTSERVLALLRATDEVPDAVETDEDPTNNESDFLGLAEVLVRVEVNDVPLGTGGRALAFLGLAEGVVDPADEGPGTAAVDEAPPRAPGSTFALWGRSKAPGPIDLEGSRASNRA